MKIEKTYLGDSVYCEFDGYSIQMFLDNGLVPYHQITMEPEVIQEFLKFIDKLKEKANPEAKEVKSEREAQLEEALKIYKEADKNSVLPTSILTYHQQQKIQSLLNT